MKNDYLWDKTGEPDPDVQALEEVLGTLRYRPRAFAVPSSVRRRVQSSSLLKLIAASIALLLIGFGLWFGLNKRRPVGVAVVPAKQNESQTTNDSASTAKHETDAAPQNEAIQTQLQSTTAAHNPRHRTLIARSNISRTNKASDRDERAQAQFAKQQLMIALRVASEKLNIAQKRAQGTTPSNLIRNQHKIG